MTIHDTVRRIASIDMFSRDAETNEVNTGIFAGAGAGELELSLVEFYEFDGLIDR